MTKLRRPERGRSDADRRLRQASRHARTIQVLRRISGSGKWTAKSLAEDLECAERTIHRDLAVLELAGVPWYFDKAKGGYQVRGDRCLSDLRLSDDELFGLVAMTAVSSAPGMEIGKSTRVFTSRLQSSLPAAKQRLLINALEITQVLQLKLADHRQAKEPLRTIQVALLERRCLQGVYFSPYLDRPVNLSLNPFRLCLIGQAWYLIARSESDKTVKTYRAARFQSLRQTTQAATGVEAFDLKAYLGNAWSVFRGDKRHRVCLWFSKIATSLVLETCWHATQQHQILPNGEAIVTFEVDGLEEILWWVLGWSSRVTVLEPPELKSRVVQALELARAMQGHANA